MSSSELIRWGGLAAMLAGATFIVLMLIPEGPPDSSGAGGVPRPAEGDLRARRTRRLLHGHRGRGSPDRSPARPHVWEHGPRISRLFGALGRDGREGAQQPRNRHHVCARQPRRFLESL